MCDFVFGLEAVVEILKSKISGIICITDIIFTNFLQ